MAARWNARRSWRPSRHGSGSCGAAGATSCPPRRRRLLRRADDCRLAMPAHPGDKDTIFHAHQKAAHRAHADVELEAGNQRRGAGARPLRAWHPPEVLHFSFRSFAQLERKARGARASQTAYEPTLTGSSDEAFREVDWRRSTTRTRSTTKSSRAGWRTARCRRHAPARRAPRPPRRGRGVHASRGWPRLSRSTPSAEDDAAYAAEASILVEIDGIVRAEQRVRALEGRLDALDGMPSLGEFVDWRVDDAGHDAPRARRDRHRRVVARVPSGTPAPTS